MAKLERDAFNQIHLAILEAFPSEHSLEMMLRFEMNEQLNTIAGGRNLSEMVFSLVTWAETHNQVEHLLKGALKQNRSNEMLKESFIDFILNQNNNSSNVTNPVSNVESFQGKLSNVANELDPSKMDTILYTNAGEFNLLKGADSIYSEFAPNTARLFVWGIEYRKATTLIDRVFGGDGYSMCHLILTVIKPDGQMRCSYTLDTWRSGKHNESWEIRWLNDTSIFVRIPKDTVIEFPHAVYAGNKDSHNKRNRPIHLPGHGPWYAAYFTQIPIPHGDYQFTLDNNNSITKIMSY